MKLFIAFLFLIIDVAFSLRCSDRERDCRNRCSPGGFRLSCSEDSAHYVSDDCECIAAVGDHCALRTEDCRDRCNPGGFRWTCSEDTDHRVREDCKCIPRVNDHCEQRKRDCEAQCRPGAITWSCSEDADHQVRESCACNSIVRESPHVHANSYSVCRPVDDDCKRRCENMELSFRSNCESLGDRAIQQICFCPREAGDTNPCDYQKRQCANQCGSRRPIFQCHAVGRELRWYTCSCEDIN